MRLGDLDRLAKDIELAIEDAPLHIQVTVQQYIDCSPPIDPIHAAGGCYCRECKFAAQDGAYQYPGQEDTHVNCTQYLTSAHSVLIKPKNGFCDNGKLREAQDDE